MPQAIRTATRIQDQDDFTGALAADQFIQCDGSNFLLAAIVTGVADTRANILARSSDPTPTFALATDTREVLVWDGTNWNALPLEVNIESQAPDMGAYVPGGLAPITDKSGYYPTFITDKDFYNIAIKGSARTVIGGLRIDTTQDPDTFEIYLRGVWQDIMYDFTFENDELEHAPVGETIDVWSGNSNLLGLNGLPIVQEYQVSMGAFPAKKIISGGTF
jgi:hypothetical protein